MRQDSILEISEDKAIKITYGALVGMFVALCGLAAWMTSVEFNAREIKEKVEYISADQVKFQEEVRSTLYSIDKRTSRIEVLLENKTKGE
jgi:hypothetical protein